MVEIEGTWERNKPPTHFLTFYYKEVNVGCLNSAYKLSEHNFVVQVRFVPEEYNICNHI